MTLNEVMALSDEELRVKAAELRGWTVIESQTFPSGHTLVSGAKPGTTEPIVFLPDYPHDIAAAWELAWMVCQQRGMWMRVTTPFVAGEPCWAGFCPQQVTGWNGRMDVEAPGDRTEQAIMRAFVLVMTRGKP